MRRALSRQAGAPVLLFLLLATPAAAQDTLHLPALHEAAVRRDPRLRQLALQESATDLTLRNLASERLPRLTAGLEGIYQTEVPRIPVRIPGAEVPEPPKDRYAATVDVEQLLYDGGALARRGDVARAQLAVASAEVAAALYPLRVEVDEAFFGAVLLQEREAEIAILIDDLEARLALVRVQVEAGTALPGDTAAVLAELLGAAQSRDEIAADRRAALAVLAELTGREIADTDVLALPDLAAQVARARDAATPAALRARPEYARFDAQRERLDREAALVAARARPRIVAFGQAGFGRPGLEQFTDELHGYSLAGIRVGWTPWDWGTRGREREILQVERRIVATEEAAFTERLRRQVQDDLQSMDRLEATLETDERIIALREQIERQAWVQLDERAITTAAYLDVRTDLQEARVIRRRHLVELARARAHYLTTLGIELR